MYSKIRVSQKYTLRLFLFEACFYKKHKNCFFTIILTKILLNFEELSFSLRRNFIVFKLTNCHKSILDRIILLFDFDYQYFFYGLKIHNNYFTSSLGMQTPSHKMIIMVNHIIFLHYLIITRLLVLHVMALIVVIINDNNFYFICFVIMLCDISSYDSFCIQIVVKQLLLLLLL